MKLFIATLPLVAFALGCSSASVPPEDTYIDPRTPVVVNASSNNAIGAGAGGNNQPAPASPTDGGAVVNPAIDGGLVTPGLNQLPGQSLQPGNAAGNGNQSLPNQFPDQTFANANWDF